MPESTAAATVATDRERGGVPVTPEDINAALVSLLDDDRTACRLWPAQDEGPYHREDAPTRRDVAEDRDGVPLVVGVRLLAPSGEPVTGAVVEVWHCDALGRYSGFPPPATPDGADPEVAAGYLPDRAFLRGRQPTGTDGIAAFRTIYPGWYPGRTVHIHLMAHVGGRRFTSQLYFPDATSDEVLARAPYRERPGRDTTNATDTIFPTGGEPAVLRVVARDDGFLAAACLLLPAA
jgi:protocatechuate 3,4-dioxygenase beta subunit